MTPTANGYCHGCCLLGYRFDPGFKSRTPNNGTSPTKTQLGAGTYAEVYRCTHRKTRKERAVKIVMLDRLTHEDDLRALEEEIEILSTLRVRA